MVTTVSARRGTESQLFVALVDIWAGQSQKRRNIKHKKCRGVVLTLSLFACLQRAGRWFGPGQTEVGGDDAIGHGGVTGRSLLVGHRPVTRRFGNLPLTRQGGLFHWSGLREGEKAKFR